VLFVQRARHQRLLNPGQRAVGHRGSRGDAQQLTCQASLTEELTVAQNGDDRFLALLGCHRELHLASSQVKHGICRFSLPEDDAIRAIFYNGFPVGDSSQERFPIDRRAFLTHQNNLPLVAEGEPVVVKGISF
jgi:hypothetical protein